MSTKGELDRTFICSDAWSRAMRSVSNRWRESDDREASDEAFDAVYPAAAREASTVHWTPVSVARRAAELLVAFEGARILDVGSGVGKFCIVGAETTAGFFTGVEQRAHLVRTARRAARCRGVAGRCDFRWGNATDLDWSDYDGFYLYNPFAEHRRGWDPLDQTIELSPRHFVDYVDYVRGQLNRARPGTRVVTYCGFGGTMPDGWREVTTETFIMNPLVLWVKVLAT